MIDADHVGTRPTPHRWMLRTALVLGALIVLAGGIGAAYLWSLVHGFEDQVTALPPQEVFPAETLRPLPADPGTSEDAPAQNILLLGSDLRGSIGGASLESLRGQRSDAIMVVHIPGDRENIQVMSIMRDNWVPIPGHGEAKINAALAWGGVPLTVQTVESMIGVRIDHVAIVDFEGFKGMTDALGGVTVQNKLAFGSFPEGEITLNGTEALAFVRDRYSFPDGDYSRARNQQAYLKGLIGGILTKETLLNPGRVASLVGALAPHLMVDSGMSAVYAAELGLQLGGVRSDDITFFTSPTLGTSTSADGESIVLPDWAELEKITQAFADDALDEYTPKAQVVAGG
ncbi:MAG TPA: LCP family protein [Microbacterium sp.]|nr:LCP family protein [Microbacterium sp.]